MAASDQPRMGWGFGPHQPDLAGPDRRANEPRDSASEIWVRHDHKPLLNERCGIAGGGRWTVLLMRAEHCQPVLAVGAINGDGDARSAGALTRSVCWGRFVDIGNHADAGLAAIGLRDLPQSMRTRYYFVTAILFGLAPNGNLSWRTSEMQAGGRALPSARSAAAFL